MNYQFDPSLLSAITRARQSMAANMTGYQLIAEQLPQQQETFMRQVINTNLSVAKLASVVPKVPFNYANLFPNYRLILEQTNRQLFSAFEVIRAAQRTQFADLYKNLAAKVDAMYPPNWHGLSKPQLAVIEVLTLDEGLAVGWVPDSETLNLLLDAPDEQARRRIIGRRWKRITSDCKSQLLQIDQTKVKHHVPYAVEACEVLLSGTNAASQALSANLLDSVLRKHFNETDRRSIVSQGSRLSTDEFTVKAAIVLGGIWGAFGEYWPGQGDPIPYKFSRHASAHGVSRQQFSRVNAVIAAMHVTALLQLLDCELT